MMRKFSLIYVLFVSSVSTLAAQEAGQARVLQLSLHRAIEIAQTSEGNTQIQLAEEGVKLAQARAAQARANLMPNLEGSAGVQDLTRSLSTLGLDLSGIGLSFERIVGQSLHSLDFVGPFSVYDARLNFDQNILDFSLLQRLKSSRAGVDVASADLDNIKDRIAGQVARLYLWAVRTDVMVTTARDNLSLAETLLKNVEDRRAAGTGIALETSRAQVQLANARQALLVAENERVKTQMTLLKALNMDMDVPLDLTDKLTSRPFAVPTFEEAMARATAGRADYRAQEQRIETARMKYRASDLERLPSIHGIADYGSVGPSLTTNRPTRGLGISARIPLFDGGRRKARLAEEATNVREEEIRLRELRNDIELSVRLALNSLHSAEMQMKTAEEGMSLAEEELGHARRRYESGITSNPEVTDAQNRVERSRDNYTDALFNYNSSWIDLLVASGRVSDLMAEAY